MGGDKVQKIDMNYSCNPRYVAGNNITFLVKKKKENGCVLSYLRKKL